MGQRLLGRAVPARARLPATQFTIWWWGLALSAGLSGVEGVLWGVGLLNLAFSLTCEVLDIMALTVALWGLLGYLTYLYTGNYRLREWTAFYAVFFVTILYYEFLIGPVGVTAKGGVPMIVDAHTAFVSLPVLIYLVVALLVPEFVGIVLYFSLIRRTADRTLRFRIAFVSLSLALFFGIDLLSLPASLVRPELWNLVKSLIGAGASVLSLFAFFPPAWLQRSLGIEAVTGPNHSPMEDRVVA